MEEQTAGAQCSFFTAGERWSPLHDGKQHRSRVTSTRPAAFPCPTRRRRRTTCPRPSPPTAPARAVPGHGLSVVKWPRRPARFCASELHHAGADTKQFWPAAWLSAGRSYPSQHRPGSAVEVDDWLPWAEAVKSGWVHEQRSKYSTSRATCDEAVGSRLGCDVDGRFPLD